MRNLKGLTLTQTLHALGYGHESNGRGDGAHYVYRLDDGARVGELKAGECWEWLRDEGHDV